MPLPCPNWHLASVSSRHVPERAAGCASPLRRVPQRPPTEVRYADESAVTQGRRQRTAAPGGELILRAARRCIVGEENAGSARNWTDGRLHTPARRHRAHDRGATCPERPPSSDLPRSDVCRSPPERSARRRRGRSRGSSHHPGPASARSRVGQAPHRPGPASTRPRVGRARADRRSPMTKSNSPNSPNSRSLPVSWWRRPSRATPTTSARHAH
jgi:hypothetical protein